VLVLLSERFHKSVDLDIAGRRARAGFAGSPFRDKQDQRYCRCVNIHPLLPLPPKKAVAP
jgi:hypothetical protein